MTRRRTNEKRNAFEQLETRLALAGNVVSSIVNNGLLLTGDNSANVIVVEQTSPTSFKVTGAATKVNGSSSAQTFNNITNGLFLDMMGGSDVVTLKKMTVPSQAIDQLALGILLGEGNDVLVMTGVSVNGATGIDGGTGNNTIAVDKGTFNYNLGIQTYGGVDAVVITNSTVFGALSIQLGDGTNALTMVSDKILEAEIKGDGGGNQLPEDFSVLEDAFFPIDCGAIITGGDGVDAITMNKVQIDCLTQIDTDGGVDVVTIVNSRFGNLLELPTYESGPEDVGLCIETGLGNDVVTITNTKVFGHLQIDTSGEVPCLFEVMPSQEGEAVKDGNDAVALVKVDVLQAATQEQCVEWSSEWGESWLVDGSLCGSLSIYTGNQIDAVTLVKVNTDCNAFIRTTDREDSSLDGTDVVTITTSNFNRNGTNLIVGVANLGLDIFTGRGNDVVTIVKVNVVGGAQVETGDGTDVVTVNALAADSIYIDLDGGNYDVLTIVNSKARFARFDGGGDTGDSLVEAHNSFDNEVDLGFRFINGKPQL